MPVLPNAVAGVIRVDGNPPCTGTLGRQNGKEVVTIKAGGVTDGTFLKPFVFSTLELTDDDSAFGTSLSSPEKLGLIQLTLSPVEVLGSKDGTGFLDHYEVPDQKVHERTKKAVTQQIKLAEAEILENPKPFAKLRRSGADIVTFSFEYRPIDVLRANGVVPPPTILKRKAAAECSSPPVEDRDRDDAEELAALEEVKALREKLRGLEEKLFMIRDVKPRIKSEKTSATIDLTQDRFKRKRVKVEAKPSFIPGEVIDLT
ncbi:hypothetical protein R3P38DRAFT_3367349 [Favolaschia claudopus]|uniref:DUF7918 domain-containing protein n=1 Tax=Favolaschia claudopus TaxID=2862362 RepID=A0AAW0AAX9_9AGAR